MTHVYVVHGLNGILYISDLERQAVAFCENLQSQGKRYYLKLVRYELNGVSANPHMSREYNR